MDMIPLSGTTTDRVLSDIRRVSVKRVPDGSGVGGWINGLSNTLLFLRHPKKHVVVIDKRDEFPGIRESLLALEFGTGHHQLTQVMLNVLHANGSLAPHRDGLPDDFRYHLPVVTNPHVKWWDEINGERHMQPGYWHGPVSYCGVLHSVVNNGSESRIHIVADYAKEPLNV